MEETTIAMMPLSLDEPFVGDPVWVEAGGTHEEPGEWTGGLFPWQDPEVDIMNNDTLPPPTSSPFEQESCQQNETVEQACDVVMMLDGNQKIESVHPAGSVFVTDPKQVSLPPSLPEIEPTPVEEVQEEAQVTPCLETEADDTLALPDEKECEEAYEEPHVVAVSEGVQADDSEELVETTDAVSSGEPNPQEEFTEEIEDYSDEAYPPCCIMEFKQGFYPIFNPLPFGPVEQDILFSCDANAFTHQVACTLDAPKDAQSLAVPTSRNRSNSTSVLGGSSGVESVVENNGETESQQSFYIELFEGSLTQFIAEIKKLFGITNDITIEFPQLDLSLTESSMHCSTTSLKQLNDFLYALQVDQGLERFEPLKIAVFEARNSFAKQFEHLASLLYRLEESAANPLESMDELEHPQEEYEMPTDPEPVVLQQSVETVEPALETDLEVVEQDVQEEAEGFYEENEGNAIEAEPDMMYEEQATDQVDLEQDPVELMEQETIPLVDDMFPPEEYSAESLLPNDASSEWPEETSLVEGNLKRKEADALDLEQADTQVGSDAIKRIRV